MPNDGCGHNEGTAAERRTEFPLCPLTDCKHWRQWGRGRGRICEDVRLSAYRHYNKEYGQIVAVLCDGYESSDNKHIFTQKGGEESCREKVLSQR